MFGAIAQCISTRAFEGGSNRLEVQTQARYTEKSARTEPRTKIANNNGACEGSRQRVVKVADQAGHKVAKTQQEYDHNHTIGSK